MPAYDDRLFSPAAAVVPVTLRGLHSIKIQSEILMLIDSGADVTLVPKSAVDSLELERSDRRFELVAFDGSKSESEEIHAELTFLGRVSEDGFW